MAPGPRPILLAALLPGCIYLGDDPEPFLEVREATRLEVGESVESASDFEAFATGEVARCEYGVQGGYWMPVSVLIGDLGGASARTCPDGVCDGDGGALQIRFALGDSEGDYSWGAGFVREPVLLTDRGVFAPRAIVALGVDRRDGDGWVPLQDGDIVPVRATVSDAFGNEARARVEVALDLPDP